MKKKSLAILLAAAMAVTAAGCGGGGTETKEASEGGATTENGVAAENGATENGSAAGGSLAAEILGMTMPTSTTSDELVVAVNSDPGTMDPYGPTFGPQLTFTTQAIETLFLYDANGQAVPLLAESLEMDEDLCGGTLHLRKGVKFHDGNEMKAEDVAYSFEKMSETGAGKSFLSIIDYANIEVIDEYTLHIPTTSVCGILDTTLTNLFVIEKSVYDAEHEANATFTGTGPFVAKKWDPGVGCEFEAFEDYWGGAPVIKSLTLNIMSESSVRMIALENEEIQVYKTAAANDLERTINSEEDGITVWRAAHSQACHFFLFNTVGPLASDPLVREAISYAIDSDTIVDIAFQGIGESGVSVIPQNNWYSPTMTDEQICKYDPEKAKTLLANAGYPDGITLHLIAPTNSQNIVAATELLPDMLKASGITLTVDLMENAAYKDYMSNHTDYDIYLANAGNLNEPVSALGGFFTRNNPAGTGGSGYMHYAESDFGTSIDEVLAKINSLTDTDARKEAYQEFCNILADNHVVKPLVDQYDTNLVRDNLKGLFMTPNMNFQFAYFE